jgi:hypothetical protein
MYGELLITQQFTIIRRGFQPPDIWLIGLIAKQLCGTADLAEPLLFGSMM